MLTLYRWLLNLYPAIYRKEYAAEMTDVFLQARDAIRNARQLARASFCAREILGLLSGAAREQCRTIAGPYNLSVKEFPVRPAFRFSRFTVFFMSISLALVFVSVEKAKTIQLKYAADSHLMTMWPALPWALAFMLLTAAATVAIVWGVLFALQRTGMHRLANLQPWVNKN